MKTCKACKCNLPLTAFRKMKIKYYAPSCKDCEKEYYTQWSSKNNRKQYKTEWARNNPEKIKASNKKRRAKQRDWLKLRRQDIKVKLATNLRTRVYHALKGINKAASTFELVGCSIEELKTYLANRFTNGMTWDNYGSWHVDHIIPCAVFDLTKEEEQRRCFHYTNLQPLWAIDNIKKKDKT